MLAQVAPDDGRVIAGGQSLVPAMALRLALPAHLVDINAVAGFDRLAVEDFSVRSPRGRSANYSQAWCGTSDIIRYARAERFAAAWRMPIPLPSGASSRQRSAPK